MSKELFKHIVDKYKPLGVIWGGEFLLPPQIMIEFIEDLSNAGVLIYGCDLWRYLDPNKDPNRVISLLGAGLDLTSDEFKKEEFSIERNAVLVKSFIENQLPDDAELVSLTTDIDEFINRMIGGRNI